MTTPLHLLTYRGNGPPGSVTRYKTGCGASWEGAYAALGDQPIECAPCLSEARRLMATPEGQRLTRAGWALSAAGLVEVDARGIWHAADS